MEEGRASEKPRRLVAAAGVTLKPHEQESAPRVVGRGTGPDKLGRAAFDEGGRGSVGQGRVTEVLGERSRARKLRNR